ncbi:MAG TPA: hypothetical protein PKN04_16440 [bacterium]|jgi:rubrerythrin|nr:hypothetical protein [bacterium]HNT67376.1 hypothetical protein [bacterium]HOX87035.1 hypothetical protein [bacterium]HPG46366.1 hypothetical protein [bacterium]HPM98720.1 hypothetical protein [bacterium]
MTQKITAIDADDALKIALQCAMDMNAFYCKASSLIDDGDAKAIFSGLAEKHLKTKARLIRAYSQVSGKKILYLQLGKKHRLNTLLPCPDSVEELFPVVEKNETEVSNFFMMISRRLFSAEVRNLFRELALECEQHIAILEASFAPQPDEDEGVEKRNSFSVIADTD